MKTTKEKGTWIGISRYGEFLLGYRQCDKLGRRVRFVELNSEVGNWAVIRTQIGDYAMVPYSEVLEFGLELIDRPKIGR